MSHIKYYCLRCERTSNCLCEDTSKHFSISNKCRVPSTKNKARFRKFLDDCVIFVNMVPEELQPDFLNLLRKVKCFNKTINGRAWTNISK